MTHRITLSSRIGLLLLASACSSAPADIDEPGASEMPLCGVSTFTTTFGGRQWRGPTFIIPSHGTPDSYPIIASCRAASSTSRSTRASRRSSPARATSSSCRTTSRCSGRPERLRGSSARKASVNDVLASMTAADANPRRRSIGSSTRTTSVCRGTRSAALPRSTPSRGAAIRPFCFGPSSCARRSSKRPPFTASTPSNPAGVLLDVNTSAAPVALLQGRRWSSDAGGAHSLSA